jgi:hypothetical protein
MTTFFGDVKNWNIPVEADIKDDRLNTYKKIVDYLNNESLCDIEVLERIGSDSTMGQVYLYKLGENNKFKEEIEEKLGEKLSLAIKILPIINSKSKIINEKEISLAKEVSNLVLSGKSPYFPLVYYDIFCNSTYYYEHNVSDFSIQSLNYQQYEYVRNFLIKNSEENKDIISNLDKLYKMTKFSKENSITKIFKTIGIYNEIPNNINSNLLFSELAYSDLKNYLFGNGKEFVKKYISQEILIKIIIQVLEGIRDLQMLCNIVHNDLHLGNVLLLFNPEYKINILIHDFGRSNKVQNPDGSRKKLSNIQKKTDILTFLNEIKKYISISYEEYEDKIINEKIELTIENLDENTKEFPILDIIDIWKL